MKFLMHEKLSPHRYKTPEGYLVCADAVLARTGDQEYYTAELWPDAKENKLIKVMRNAEDVFAPEAMASFENKPITCEHPEEDVMPDNYKNYAVGFVRDIRKGKDDKGEDVMIGNIIVTDPDCINDIENGVRTDLSCGYNCDITDEDHPRQINIRGNHIALCEEGRAGNARIIDSKMKDDNNTVVLYHELGKLLMTTLDNYNAPIQNARAIHDLGKQTVEEAKEMIQRNWPGTKVIVVKDSVKDAKQPLDAASKRKIENYLDMWNGFVKNDPDVTDIVNPLKDMGFALTRKSIDGWNKLDDGIMRKEYVFTFNKYDNILRIYLYADPNDWRVFEVSAYITSGMRTEVDDERIKNILRDREIAKKRISDAEYSEYFKRELEEQLEKQKKRFEKDEGIQNEQTKRAYDRTKKNLLEFLREQLNG